MDFIHCAKEELRKLRQLYAAQVNLRSAQIDLCRSRAEKGQTSSAAGTGHRRYICKRKRRAWTCALHVYSMRYACWIRRKNRFYCFAML